MDTWVDSEEVTLFPGGSTWVNFTGIPNEDWDFDEIGTHDVKVTPRDHPAEWYGELQIEVLFYENFEDDVFPPQGWEADEEWYRTENEYYTGGASARIDYSWCYQEELLMTPWMEVSENMTLYFWEKSDWVNYYDEHHHVGVYEGNWTWYTMPDAEGDWRQWYIELDNWTDEEVRLGFYYEGTDGTNWYVDEVVVTDSDWGNTIDLSGYEMEGSEMNDSINYPESDEGVGRNDRSKGSENREQKPEKREERLAEYFNGN